MFSADEAIALTLALKWGYLTTAQISDFAVIEIEKFEGIPPANICELAVCKNDYRATEILNEMGNGAGKWGPLTSFLSNHIDIDALEDDDLLHLAKYLSHYVGWDSEPPWSEFNTLYHELADAKFKIYGDFEELKAEFIQNVQGLIKVKVE